MNSPLPPRMDRRLAIKWMLAAGAGALLADPLSLSAASDTPTETPTWPPGGYGADPNLVKPYKAGDYWPLTFTEAQRREAAALCDIIIPAEGAAPSASSVGVADFIDEWVSAPYPTSIADRKLIMDGLSWLEAESVRRFGTGFAVSTDAQRLSLCEDMSQEAPADPGLLAGSKFFKRFRNLTATGFFTTPVGMKDLGYVGNLPSATFDGPPADLVAKLGLTDEVKW
jgi:hypothetical protein